MIGWDNMYMLVTLHGQKVVVRDLCSANDCSLACTFVLLGDVLYLLAILKALGGRGG